MFVQIYYLAIYYIMLNVYALQRLLIEFIKKNIKLKSFAKKM